MANELLNPNGSTVDVGSWAITGGDATQHEAVDEGIASADSTTYISPNAENDAITFDLDASAINDADTVNSVTIRVHARTLGAGNDRIQAELIIGGTGQGTAATGNLSGSFATTDLTLAGWDSDWTASQLDGAQVQIVATQAGKAETAGHDLSVVEVDIDYTAASASDQEWAATEGKGQQTPPDEPQRLLTAAQQALALDPQSLAFVLLDRWFYPASEPTRPNKRSAAALAASGGTFVEISVAPPESITLDKWFRQAAEPIWIKAPVNVGPSYVVDVAALTLPEITHLSKWWQPQPVIVNAAKPINVGPVFTADPAPVTEEEAPAPAGRTVIGIAAAYGPGFVGR